MKSETALSGVHNREGKLSVDQQLESQHASRGKFAVFPCNQTQFLPKSKVQDSHPYSVCLTVSVGFEYESCLDLILWEKRTAILQGYEMDASNMGGWTLDKHHILDVQSGQYKTDDKEETVFWLMFLPNILTFLMYCNPRLYRENWTQ